MKRVRLITVPRLGHLLSVGVDWVVDRVQLPPPARWLVFTIAVCQLGRTLLMRFAGVGPCTTQGLCWATIRGLCWAIYRDSAGPYTGTLLCHCTGTLLGHYTGTLLGHYIGTLIGHYTGTMLGHYTGTLLGHYAGTMLGHYTGTLLDPSPLGSPKGSTEMNCLAGTVLTLLQTCSRSCGVVSREELPATGPRSQEGEEKEIQA